jgi:hypothetical protein
MFISRKRTKIRGFLAAARECGCIDAHGDSHFHGGSAGTLVCNTSMELGVIVGSREALNCTFTPSVPGPTQSYTGTITKLGLDLGVTARGVIVWLVYAPTTLRTGELAGSYVGATGEATVGVGLGANVLVGGSNRTVALQPVSEVGLNLCSSISFTEQ